MLSQKIDDKSWSVIHPGTGEQIGTFQETPSTNIPIRYEKARTAYKSWAETSIEERLVYLRNLRFYMVDHLEEIAETISNDTGKVPVEALTADIITVLDDILYLEKHAKKILQPTKVPSSLLLFDKRSYVEYKPRGVVLVISPWNYPFQLAMIPAINALMAGNTVIIKPSEVTPLVGKLMEELFIEAGFPTDVIQVIHGGKEVGAACVQEKPAYIFFTGSVQTGKVIQAEAAKYLIPTTLELGGKDPMIVFADAPMERAVKGAIWGAFTNAGQVCMSVERLYVERSIYEEFKKRLKQEVDKLKIGSQQEHDIGSMTFKNQIHIVKKHIEDAVNKGGHLLSGKQPTAWSNRDMFLDPMIIENVNHDMDIMHLETFGPILPITPFDREEEVIQLANNSNYGLNASVWSKNIKKARSVASKLITGNVVINDVIVSVANPHLPFGGAKESGIGRYHGDAGLTTFCHQTSVMVDYGWKRKEVQWYPYKGKYPLFLDLTKSYFGKKRNWKAFIHSFIKLLKGGS